MKECQNVVKTGREIRSIEIKMLDDGYCRFIIEMDKHATVDDLKKFKESFESLINMLEKI